MSATDMPLLCVMLWAVAGEERALIEYEDRVLERVPAHEGEVLSRVRALQDGEPLEVQLLRFATEQALSEYIQDPLRDELAGLRERAILRTKVLRVEAVSR